MPKTHRTATVAYADASAESLLAAAQEFLDGALILRDNVHQNLTASFLLGFSLELTLKAFIVGRQLWGVQDAKLQTHDLVKLWTKAAETEQSPFASTPDWLANFSNTHRRHLLRYRPGNISAWALPGVSHYTEIQRLTNAVAETICSVDNPC